MSVPEAARYLTTIAAREPREPVRRGSPPRCSPTAPRYGQRCSRKGAGGTVESIGDHSLHRCGARQVAALVAPVERSLSTDGRGRRARGGGHSRGVGMGRRARRGDRAGHHHRPARRRSTLRQLVAMSIGAGDARLTPIDLTQAFGRLIIDRSLVLRFLPADTAAPSPGEPRSARPPLVSGVRLGAPRGG